MGQVRIYQIDVGGGQSGSRSARAFTETTTVDSSPDGNTLTIDYPGNQGSYHPGYVRVFSLESSDNLGTCSWKQIGQSQSSTAIIIEETIGNESLGFLFPSPRWQDDSGWRLV